MQSDYTPENKRLEAKNSPICTENHLNQTSISFGDPAVNFPGCSFVILTLAISGRRSLPIVLMRLLVACWSWRRAKLPCDVCRKFLQRMGSKGGRATLNWRVPKPMWTGTFLLCEIWNYIGDYFRSSFHFFSGCRPFAQQLESFLVILSCRYVISGLVPRALWRRNTVPWYGATMRWDTSVNALHHCDLAWSHRDEVLMRETSRYHADSWFYILFGEPFPYSCVFFSGWNKSLLPLFAVCCDAMIWNLSFFLADVFSIIFYHFFIS